MLTIPDDELRRWLAEDVPHGDLTTHALGIGSHHGRIRFEARQAMVAACSEEAGRIMALAGADMIECVPSGTALQTSGLLLAAQGRAATLHAGWKVAQTLLETAGGIAAAAQAIVEAVRQINSEVVVACTRKSLPGTRALSIKAILSGGAVPHRLGLSETILVFAQHRTFTGGASFPAIIDGLRRRVPEKKIVVEADTLAEGLAAYDVVALAVTDAAGGPAARAVTSTTSSITCFRRGGGNSRRVTEVARRDDLSKPRGSGRAIHYDPDAFGRFSEAIARFLGTGRYLAGQTRDQ